MIIENGLFNAIDDRLYNLPCNVYLKNANGVILYCNDHQAKSGGFNKASDIIGINGNDLIGKSQGEIIRKNDQMVIETNKQHTIIENASIENKPCLYLSYKIPFIMQSKKERCIFGISMPIHKDFSLLKSLTDLPHTINSINAKGLDKIFLDYILSEIGIKHIACLTGLAFRQLNMHVSKSTEIFHNQM